MPLSENMIAMSLAALFIAAIMYLANVFRASSRMALAAHGVTIVGWALLTAGLGTLVAGQQTPALSTGYQALIAVAVVVLAAHIAQVFWKDLPSFGAVALPLALVLLFMATALPNREALSQQEMLASHWLYLHVLSIIISLVLLILAAGCAILWLVQHRMLKAKKWSGAFRRFPPLEQINSLGFLFASLGFAALTIGIITAIVWGLTHPSDTQVQGMLTRMAAGASWVLYAVYMWASSRPSWRGRKAQYLLVLGCAAILLTTTLHRFFIAPGPAAPPDSRPAAHSSGDRL